MSTQTEIDWRIKGTLLQGCNCDRGCPCNFNAPPTDGSCDGAWAGHIDDGNYGDTQLNGLNFALGAAWPKAIHLGNGEGFILIDEKADEAQREALTAILTGNAGGPFGILAGTISTLHGPQFVAIDINLDAANSTVRAGGLLELDLEPIKNPVSGADAFPGIVLPQGLLTLKAPGHPRKISRSTPESALAPPVKTPPSRRSTGRYADSSILAALATFVRPV